jgi:hypothetical protein
MFEHKFLLKHKSHEKSKQTNRFETIFLSDWLNDGFGTITGATLGHHKVLKVTSAIINFGDFQWF